MDAVSCFFCLCLSLHGAGLEWYELESCLLCSLVLQNCCHGLGDVATFKFSLCSTLSLPLFLHACRALSLWFRGDLKPVWFSLSWHFWDGKWIGVAAGMCWIWVPSVFCGEFQDVFTLLCPGCGTRCPFAPLSDCSEVLGPSSGRVQLCELGWEWASHSTRDTDGKWVLQVLTLCCNPSLPMKSIWEAAKLSAHPAACVGISACQRSLRYLPRQQIHCPSFQHPQFLGHLFSCHPPPLWLQNSSHWKKGWLSSSQFRALIQLPSAISAAQALLTCPAPSVSWDQKGVGERRNYLLIYILHPQALLLNDKMMGTIKMYWPGDASFDQLMVVVFCFLQAIHLVLLLL